jgi:toluene monooxygenase system ferredoxin subunit
MAFAKVCTLEDVGEGRAARFETAGIDVIVVWPTGGEPHAFLDRCAHAELPLSSGWFDGTTIICAYHGWRFDGATGQCVTPGGCRLVSYPVHVDGADVLIDIDRR